METKLPFRNVQGFYSGLISIPLWEPSGLIDSCEYHACITRVDADYRFIEDSADGQKRYDWTTGQLGFFPRHFASGMDYSIPGAKMAAVVPPEHLLTDRMKIGRWDVVRQKTDAVAHRIFDALMMLSPSDDPLLVDSVTQALVHRVASWIDAGNPPDTRNGDRMRRVIEYVNDNLGNRLSLGELAGIACMSEFHFVRQFKRATGRTPYAYVTARRIDRAKAMLRSTVLSVATIAGACGFGDQSQLNRHFLSHARLTPIDYRRVNGPISYPAHHLSTRQTEDHHQGERLPQ